jgi:hypothetical protein
MKPKTAEANPIVYWFTPSIGLPGITSTKAMKSVGTRWRASGA